MARTTGSRPPWVASTTSVRVVRSRSSSDFPTTAPSPSRAPRRSPPRRRAARVPGRQRHGPQPPVSVRGRPGHVAGGLHLVEQLGRRLLADAEHAGQLRGGGRAVARRQEHEPERRADVSPPSATRRSCSPSTAAGSRSPADGRAAPDRPGSRGPRGCELPVVVTACPPPGSSTAAVAPTRRRWRSRRRRPPVRRSRRRRRRPRYPGDLGRGDAVEHDEDLLAGQRMRRGGYPGVDLHQPHRGLGAAAAGVASEVKRVPPRSWVGPAGAVSTVIASSTRHVVDDVNGCVPIPNGTTTSARCGGPTCTGRHGRERRVRRLPAGGAARPAAPPRHLADAQPGRGSGRGAHGRRVPEAAAPGRRAAVRRHLGVRPAGGVVHARATS